MAKYAKFYDEANAVAVTESRQAMEALGVCLRRFEDDAPVGELDAVMQEMWATRYYVDNPQIDRRAGKNDTTFRLEGRWGVASLRKNGPNEKPGIYEELRLNWLTPPGLLVSANGTPTDYPPSKDENDWSGIDAQARIIGMECYDNANAKIAGENVFYKLVIPRVATKYVREFCTALANRDPLSNPTFGLQTKLTGDFEIRGVRNADQNDGTSTVMATLAHSGGFSPGEITLSDNWNETVFSNYFKHLPDYPAAPFPPVNIAAVADNAGVQLAPATIYQIVSAGMDEESGLWMIMVSKRTAKPDEKTWVVNDRDGAYAEGEYWNQTYAWTQAKGLALSPLLNNGFPHPRRNEFDLYNGSWSAKPGSPSRYAKYYDSGWFYEIYDKFRWDHGGRYIKEVWCITCCYKYDTGVAQGQVYFHEGTNSPTGGNVTPPAAQLYGPPLMEWSHFQTLGGDKYQFKRTVKAELITTDETSNYEISSRGTSAVTIASNVTPY